jgi:hypothetical protein
MPNFVLQPGLLPRQPRVESESFLVDIGAEMLLLPSSHSDIVIPMYLAISEAFSD